MQALRSGRTDGDRSVPPSLRLQSQKKERKWGKGSKTYCVQNVSKVYGIILMVFTAILVQFIWTLTAIASSSQNPFMTFQGHMLSTCSSLFCTTDLHLTYLTVRLSVCLYLYIRLSISIYLSIFLSMYLSIYLHICLRLSVCLPAYICLSIYIYVSLSISIYISIRQPTYLPTYIAIYLSIYTHLLSIFYLFIYLPLSLHVHLPT
jgi:hypothetical protein